MEPENSQVSSTTFPVLHSLLYCSTKCRIINCKDVRARLWRPDDFIVLLQATLGDVIISARDKLLTERPELFMKDRSV